MSPLVQTPRSRGAVVKSFSLGVHHKPSIAQMYLYQLPVRLVLDQAMHVLISGIVPDPLRLYLVRKGVARLDKVVVRMPVREPPAADMSADQTHP